MTTQTDQPTQISKFITSKQFKQDLIDLGVQPTDSLLVQTKMSAFGYIPGASQAIIAALEQVVADGNIAMPTPSTHLAKPLFDLQAEMPAYDKNLTPATGVGLVPENFRLQPGVVRNNHPLYSFAAWGKDAKEICADRSYDMPFGEDSPLGKLYDLDAKVLFLGTNFETCCGLYLAESLIARPLTQQAAPVKVGQAVRWIKFFVPEINRYEDYSDLGNQFLQAYPVNMSMLPNGQVMIFKLRDLVAFAKDWFKRKDADPRFRL